MLTHRKPRRAWVEAELQVFDGRDISRGPICRALIPQHIPSGFHACWVPSNTQE